MSAKLKPIRPEVDQDLVKKAEQFVERIRSGETTGFLVLEQKRDVVAWSCSHLKDRFQVMGYLVSAILRMDDN